MYGHNASRVDSRNMQMEDNPPCSRDPLIMPGHRHPIDPEKVVAVSAEEGKGAVPGEVEGGTSCSLKIYYYFRSFC